MNDDIALNLNRRATQCIKCDPAIRRSLNGLLVTKHGRRYG